MRKPCFILLGWILFSVANSQNLVSYYKIKTKGKVYGINLTPSSSGTFFVGGLFDYLNGEPAGALIKVNQNGEKVSTFQPPVIDGGVINQAKDLSNGKVLVQGDFRTMNGVARINLARLNMKLSILLLTFQ